MNWSARVVSRNGTGKRTAGIALLLGVILLLPLLFILFPEPLAAQAANAAGVSGGPILTPYGTPAVNVPVRVCRITAIGTPCSTSGVALYSDANLTTPIANPTSTNSQGIYAFFTTAGLYLLQVQATASATYTYYISPGTSGGGVTSIATGTGLSCTPLSGGICTGAVTISLSSSFAITSFTGCSGALELGQSVTNPTCTATYTGTPTAASITNTDGIDSPLTLASPYTSGTITGTFTHSAITTTTMTLTATGTSTQTANQSYTWNPRIFAGLGSGGATSATASGTSAVLNASAGTIASAGLGAETVGQTFGPFSPSGQYVYLLLLGGSHTFTDAGTGFPFAFNAPVTVTFVNQYGVTVTMYLYQSTNALTGTFTPKVAS